MKQNNTPTNPPTPAQQEKAEAFSRDLALALRRIKEQSGNTQKAGNQQSQPGGSKSS